MNILRRAARKDTRIELVAEGPGGFGEVYSDVEVNANVHDAIVIVADSKHGWDLANSGPLQTKSTDEERPARWLRRQAPIRLLTA